MVAVHSLFWGQCAKFCDEYLHAFMLSFSHSGIFVSPFQGSKLYAFSPRASLALGGLRLPWAGMSRPVGAFAALQLRTLVDGGAKTRVLHRLPQVSS